MTNTVIYGGGRVPETKKALAAHLILRKSARLKPKKMFIHCATAINDGVSHLL